MELRMLSLLLRSLLFRAIMIPEVMTMFEQRIGDHPLLSRSYVQNVFSQHMHIGLKTYIMQKKIYAAHADLGRGLGPSEVCEKYAFGDYSVFYRLYKKTFHTSPGSKHGTARKA